MIKLFKYHNFQIKYLKKKCFEGEELVKSWSIVDPDNTSNNNTFTVSTHRVIFEKTREKRSFEHVYLSEADRLPFGIIRALYELFLFMINVLYRILNYGSDPELSYYNRNVLIKDVINIEVINNTSNMTICYLIVLLYFQVLGTSLVISYWTSFIFSYLALFQIIFFTMKKYYSQKKINSGDKIQLTTSILLGISFFLNVFKFTFAYFYHINNNNSPTDWWLATISGTLCIIINIILIRMNLRDTHLSSLLKLSTRRGDHYIALNNKDIIDARNTVWDLRTDIKPYGIN